MKFVFLSYIPTPQYTQPADWIKRISGYFGVLEALSDQHTVMSIEQINYEGEYHSNGVTAYFVNYGKKKLRFPGKLHRFVAGLKPDIVVVHGLNFPLQVIQLRMSLPAGLRLILQSHADKPPQGWRKGLQRMADRCTNAYLFTSMDMAAGWIEKRLIRSDKVRELMIGSSVLSRVDKEAARRVTGCTGEPVFVWAGRLDKNKDPLNIVNAFMEYAKMHPRARLYMIYQTEELLGEVKARLAVDPHSDSVVLAGKVRHEDMGYWFSAADFVISTSHAEAFGLAVVEAMSCGCVPIVSDIPSYRKITNDGRCGLLFEAGNTGSLVRMLESGSRLNLAEEQVKIARQFDENLSFHSIAARLAGIAGSL